MEVSEQISDLRKKSLLHGVEFEWIESDELEWPYRDLLFHQRDMTSTLARFHGAEISLKILQERSEGDSYLREVLLSAGPKPVEYGLIEVAVNHFEESLRNKILSGKEPLGGILNDSGLDYHSQPVGFFQIESRKFTPDFFPSAGGKFLFGRYNTLFDGDRQMLARIVEILPYEES
ncbi:MAG: hypothetical protein OSA93_06195 [Akkermansiaceae bacterium]|jgi:hypothetical protein|nr:hypothetical protein [Akkermansiaceae bacterium]